MSLILSRTAINKFVSKSFTAEKSRFTSQLQKYRKVSLVCSKKINQKPDEWQQFSPALPSPHLRLTPLTLFLARTYIRRSNDAEHEYWFRKNNWQFHSNRAVWSFHPRKRGDSEREIDKKWIAERNHSERSVSAKEFVRASSNVDQKWLHECQFDPLEHTDRTWTYPASAEQNQIWFDLDPDWNVIENERENLLKLALEGEVQAFVNEVRRIASRTFFQFTKSNLGSPNGFITRICPSVER